MNFIDLRSDTVTQPTDEMRKAMALAEVGDDVYGEDPTINQLQETAAELFGKEDALFVTSGTMGNQLSILSHTCRGEEIILESNSHIFLYEVGGAAFLSGVQTRCINGIHGIMNPVDIIKNIRGEDIHFPKTGLICLENTHNQAGGTVIPLEILRQIWEIGKTNSIPIHMDGARIFNAATFLKKDVKDIAQYVDSIMFCVSKGLSAPVGSLIIGSKTFIKKARKYRKMLGGGMRQAGVLAAAALISLNKMTERLEEDHIHARRMAEELHQIDGIDIDLTTVQTNIIYLDTQKSGLSSDELSRLLKSEKILANSAGSYRLRMVTHRHITDEDIDKTIMMVRKIVSTNKRA